MMEGSLGNEYQGVRLLLLERPRFRGNAVGPERGRLGPLDVTGRGQRLHEHRAGLGASRPRITTVPSTSRYT